MITILQTDITELAVDVIVNAANTELKRGGGVDGAIHHAAGPDLQKALDKFGGCRLGGTVVTPGFKLKAKHIVHTVGPVWNEDCIYECDTLLTACYRNSLVQALGLKAKTVAIPAIGTGIYRFPKDRAARIAVRECLFVSKQFPEMNIILVAFDRETFNLYTNLIEGA